MVLGVGDFSLDGIANLFFNLVKTVYEALKDVITSFMTFFEFDNPKRSLMLSILMLFGIVSVIALFSSTDMLSSGVHGVTGESYYTYNGAGDETIEGGGGGVSPTSTTQEPTNGGSVQCYTDNDCREQLGNEVFESYCCLPEKYEGYYCAGRCLVHTGLERDACKLPNSCGAETSLVKQYLQNSVESSCLYKDVDETRRDLHCQTKTGSTTEYLNYGGCCEDKGDIGFGMCLKNVEGANCGDYQDVYHEKEIVITAVEVSYL